MSGDHGDGHHHDDEQEHGHHHGAPPTLAEARARALESLLIEKGLISTDLIDRFVEFYQNDVGPMLGAKIVARAWVDPAFKQRLLADAKAAIAELGVPLPAGADLRVIENTPQAHNMVVCSLCSCYPSNVLGLPPRWYKSFAYRSRAVREPRAVLREFGLELAPSVEVRVWDSSSEVRYLVLPERPADTEHMSEAELAALVSRDAMIGVANVPAPEPAAPRR
ncbi:MAG: nitrile hydratase subunit alpha [Chloroflexi bacterium]|nr:nitrile hydratase subunit alpha [Chloroflexota bacterium]